MSSSLWDLFKSFSDRHLVFQEKVMGQLTEKFVDDMISCCERMEHPPLTVWEAEQLLRSWKEWKRLQEFTDEMGESNGGGIFLPKHEDGRWCWYVSRCSRAELENALTRIGFTGVREALCGQDKSNIDSA